MDKYYYRPIVQTDPMRPQDAYRLAGGWCWFDRVERFSRGGEAEIVMAKDVPGPVLKALNTPRTAMAGLDFSAPQLMGILNVTPDSFSDGGRFCDVDHAVMHARLMVAGGADILDIGGESTRPGAALVPAKEEMARVVPVIRAVKSALKTPVSVDTRKADVAASALSAGADLVNDVSAFSHDPSMAAVISDRAVPVCLMHALGPPETMQDAPKYIDVVMDIFDFLEERIEMAEAAGIPRSRILVDPGIGFGKTQAHNLELLRRIALFHGLGCAILLGVSRKGFIGRIGKAAAPDRRAPGSIALALGAVQQGVQVLRVHDIEETRQALNLAMAVHENE